MTACLELLDVALARRELLPQGSGVLRSMTQANCLIVLPDAQGDVAAGDWVEVMLFEGLV